MTTLTIPGYLKPITLEVSPTKPLFILGRNGTGKSALVNALQQQLGGRTVYLPGTRTGVFDGEGLGMTPNSRRQLAQSLFGWDSSPDTRWRVIGGNQRNEKAIHDLSSSEIQYKLELANQVANGNALPAIDKLQSNDSPLDRVNLLLEQSNLPVRIIVDNAELKATQSGSVYSFARMSDGERIALILIAEVVSASDSAVFLIDEPELHLHRAIILPLIKALVRARPTCEFIICTHELELPTEVPNAKVCIVRSAKWLHENVSAWDIDVIETTNIPEGLRSDVLGSRRKVLFIEGQVDSLDRPMYAILFPKASVCSKESCRDVMRAVAGVRGTSGLHHAEAYGLIDNDGMSDVQSAELMETGVYPLAVFAVESLYYSPEVMAAVAHRQAGTAKANEVEQRALSEAYLADARSKGLAAITHGDRVPHLASRIAQRQIRDKLISLLPSRKAMMADDAGAIMITIPPLYEAELSRLEALISEENLDAIISRYPVRETGAFDAIAKALRFQGRGDYEAAALTRVSSDESLKQILRNKIRPLSTILS